MNSDLERAVRRHRGARVGDDQVHLVREPVAVERLAQLGIELLAGHVGPQRDVEVVRPQLDSLPHRRGEDERAAALEATDLRDRAGDGVAAEPVEQRCLVDLQRGDAVIQLVRREEKGQILEPVQAVRPPLDVPKAHGRRIAQDGRVNQVLPRRSPAGPAYELLQVQHGTDATATCAGTPMRGAGPRAARPRGRRSRARARPRRPERARRRAAAARRRPRRARRTRAPRGRRPPRPRRTAPSATSSTAEDERGRHGEPGGDPAEAERGAQRPVDAHLHDERREREQRAATAARPRTKSSGYVTVTATEATIHGER